MPGWGRGPRRERTFERGELKYLFLDLLREKPRHGYDLMRAIEERSGGRYSASPGAVYPILQMLEDLGHVSVLQADGRKTYSLTPAGEAFLDENAETVAEIWRRTHETWHGPGHGGRGDGHEWRKSAEDWHHVWHELGSFRTLMAHKGRRLTPDALTRIVAVLNRARLDIEAILEELD